jgi:hypothetical protein
MAVEDTPFEAIALQPAPTCHSPKDRSASDGQQKVANPDAFTLSNDRPPTIHLFVIVANGVIWRKPVCEGLLNVL